MLSGRYYKNNSQSFVVRLLFGSFGIVADQPPAQTHANLHNVSDIRNLFQETRMHETYNT
jgi:hypothetical protein